MEVTDLMGTAVRLSTPLLIAALGEIIVERAGMFNFGIEGIMLIAAFASFTTAFISNNIWLGLLAGVSAGVLLGLIFAITAIKLKIHQAVCGITIWFLGLYLSSLLYDLLFAGKLLTIWEIGLHPIHIPLLSQIPFLGPIFFQQNIFIYAIFLLIPICYILMFRTNFGLKIRATGENPRAAESLGVNVHRIRYISVVIGAMLAGIAGCYFSLGTVYTYRQELVAGGGFIAFALVWFGKWTIKWVVIGAFLFGFIEMLAIYILTIGIPISSHVVYMFPYVAALLALAMRRGKGGCPAAMGVPY